MGKIIGFTLSEVLITLGVIGIVAAMTLPTLIQNAKEKATVAKVRETYAILSQAYKHAVAEYGTPEGWYTGTGGMYDPQSHIDMATPMIQYMKLATNCVGQNDSYTKKYCTNNYAYRKYWAPVKLLNGVSVIFRTWTGSCSGKYATIYKNNTCVYVKQFVDKN
jgi:prepilin-type N-terminal cleavage/methylation domain-containing protein